MSDIDVKLIGEIINMFEESSLSSFEVESGELRVRMEKNQAGNPQPMYAETRAGAKQPEPQSKEQEEEQSSTDWEDTVDVKSPIVGTFHSLKAIGRENEIQAGQEVKKGETLCVIEAMKLMNEIECDYDGQIYKVLVKEGDMVEYGQPLFKIRPEKE